MLFNTLVKTYFVKSYNELWIPITVTHCIVIFKYVLLMYVVDLQCFRFTASLFSYTNTHILFLKLFSTIGYSKILTIVPYTTQ